MIECFGRFIPGSSASDVHFQASLLEGLTRWNKPEHYLPHSTAQQQPHMRVFNLQLAYDVSLEYCSFIQVGKKVWSQVGSGNILVRIHICVYVCVCV